MSEPPRRRPLWQIGLRTLFLVMTAAAVWTVYVTNRYATQHYEERIAAMRPLARELAVKDPSQVAVVKLEPYWYDENRWAVHLPEGTYRLCLATRDVDESGLAPVVASAPLTAGRHELALQQERTDDGWRVTVDCDGATVLSADEPQEWYPARGSSGGSEFDLSTQRDPAKPVVLFRRRFAQPKAAGRGSSTPKGRTDGIIVWLERHADDSEAGDEPME